MRLAQKPKQELINLLNYLQAREGKEGDIPTLEVHRTLNMLLDEKTLESDAQTQITKLITLTDSLPADAFTLLGICYRYGIGVMQEDSTAFTFFKQATEAGSVPSQSNLGTCYHAGNGVTKDLVKAVALYQQSAAKGWGPAQHNLGVCYQKGLGGLPTDLTLAADNFKKAADQGIPLAQFQIAESLSKGLGVTVNIPLAVSYYQKAAAQGIAAAETEVGTFLLEGKGLPQDIAQGLRLLEHAADEGGVAKAQAWLGQIYHLSQYNVNRDEEKAIHYYRLALKQEPNNVLALNNLAILLSKTFRSDDSIDLLEKAVSLGCSSAMYNLASYISSKNPKRAFDLYFQAAEGGDMSALETIGDYYRKGDTVVAEDKGYAKKIFYRTSNRYNWKGLKNLYGKAFEDKKMIGRACILYYAENDKETVTKFKEKYPHYQFEDLNAAVHYFQAQRTPEALDTIGFCYQLGLGLSKNLNKAIECYKQAIQEGWRLCPTDLLTCYQELFKTGELVLTPELIIYFNQSFSDPAVNKEALLCLAYGYETGSTPNYQLAQHYFEKAVNITGSKEEPRNNIRRLQPVMNSFFAIKKQIKETPVWKHLTPGVDDVIASYTIERPKKAL